MASKFKGYAGRVLDVDLSTGSAGEYALTDEDREKFLGGRAISTKILWDELKPGTDPLSPENILVIMTSPLTGSGGPSTSRYDISAKSPLTGGIGHSNSGGNFGIHLKRAGWDGIVVRGKARGPVYLDVREDNIVIEPAGHLWGMNTEEAQEAMGEGGKMVIGPGGENLVKYAVVVSNERVHGRTGMGAVMGSKNLKGIVTKGKRKIELDQTEAFRSGVKEWVKMLQNHPATGDLSPRLGTAQFVNILSKKNALPTRNFSRGTFEGAHRISGEALAEKYLVRNSGCTSCPIKCGRVVKLDGKEIKGPEYEVLCLMGSNLEIDDLGAIIRWNYELDLLGIDTITTGNVLGFAAELNEKGLWDNNIEFGKKENISELIKAIAYRKGLGEDLAQGVRALSEKYGGKEFAAHSKGLEVAGYEPRAAAGHALGYATANRGACHLDGGYMIYFEVNGPMTLEPQHYQSKPPWTILDQNLMAAIGAAGNCVFTAWTFVPNFAYKLPGMKIMSTLVSKMLTYTWFFVTMMLKLPPALLSIHLPILPHSKMLGLATGMEMNLGLLLRVGDRAYTLERLFNLREGIKKDKDSLAKRFTDVPLEEGNEKSKVHLKQMLPKYYKIRGWDKNGVPTAKTTKRLGLDFVDLKNL